MKKVLHNEKFDINSAWRLVFRWKIAFQMAIAFEWVCVRAPDVRIKYVYSIRSFPGLSVSLDDI